MRTIHHRSPNPTTDPQPSPKPHPNLPQGEGAPHNRLKHSKKELPPLGEDLGRGFRRFGEGLLSAAVFLPAKAGLFERPKAAFFTVAEDGVMPCMTMGMVETTRRKTRFPTVGTDSHTKAKPPSSTTAFCINSIPLIDAIKVEKHMIEPTQSPPRRSRNPPPRLFVSTPSPS